MDVIAMSSQPSQIVWVALSTTGSLISIWALTSLNQRIAKQAFPADVMTRTARNKRVMFVLLGMSIVIGVITDSFVKLPTPVVNHYLYNQPLGWGGWWEAVGSAVFSAIALIFVAKVVLYRVFRGRMLPQVIPNLRERVAFVVYDATFEAGLVLFGWLSGFLWVTQRIYGTPQVFVSICGVALVSIGFHIWTSTLLRGFTWMIFWTTFFTQMILVCVFGALVMRTGLEAGAVGRALTAAVFLWPSNRRSREIAQEVTGAHE